MNLKTDTMNISSFKATTKTSTALATRDVGKFNWHPRYFPQMTKLGAVGFCFLCLFWFGSSFYYFYFFSWATLQTTLGQTIYDLGGFTLLILLKSSALTLIPLGIILCLNKFWTYSNGNSNKCDPNKKNSPKAIFRTLLCLTFLFSCLLISPASHALITGKKLSEQQFAGPVVYVAEIIKQQELSGNFFTSSRWKDYLTWQFKDSNFTTSSLHFQSTHSQSSNLIASIKRNQFQYLILSRDEHPMLIRQVIHSPKCEILYKDQQSVLVKIL